MSSDVLIITFSMNGNSGDYSSQINVAKYLTNLLSTVESNNICNVSNTIRSFSLCHKPHWMVTRFVSTAVFEIVVGHRTFSDQNCYTH